MAEKDPEARKDQGQGKTPGGAQTGGYKALSPSGGSLERWRTEAAKSAPRTARAECVRLRRKK